MRSLLRGMIAVCGIGSPSGWRNSAVTANQSARPPTMAASAKERTKPAQGRPARTPRDEEHPPPLRRAAQSRPAACAPAQAAVDPDEWRGCPCLAQTIRPGWFIPPADPIATGLARIIADVAARAMLDRLAGRLDLVTGTIGEQTPADFRPDPAFEPGREAEASPERSRSVSSGRQREATDHGQAHRRAPRRSRPDSDSAVGTMPATIATVVITIGWRACARHR